MTHPACGECKYSEIEGKDQSKLCLIAIFSSGYKKMLISSGDIVLQNGGLVAIWRPQDLKDVRECVVFMVFEMFSHAHTNAADSGRK